MLSKNTYNILLLYYIYSTLFIKLFLNFRKLNLKVSYIKSIKKKNSEIVKYSINNYVFFSHNWYIFYFTVFFLRDFTSDSPSTMTKRLYKQHTLNRKKMWI